MKTPPSATYRLQFNPEFPFTAAETLIDYFRDLGISHVYASPVFASPRGSTHGYNVTDPNEINSELGTIQQFENLLSVLKQRGIGWIQDIVPNHMAFDSHNRMLMDVFEYGTASQYYNYFDVDWNHSQETMKGRLLAPFLGKFYGECLENGEIRISFDERGLQVNYYELCFPLSIPSYPRVFIAQLHDLESQMDKSHPDFERFTTLIESFRAPVGQSDPAKYREQIESAKNVLWRLYSTNNNIKIFIDKNIQFYNGQKGDPNSFNALDELLSEQLFRLSFWKVATEEINYRRFFNINQLISVRVEDECVFRSTHSLISRMLWSGEFSGVRVDHIDGLYDPAQYLQRLREIDPESFIVAEKILHPDEDLPAAWPVEGTTGYDFLNFVNGVFCERQNDKRFERIYSRFIGRFLQYDSLVADKKRLIIGRHMAGDIDQLAHLLKRLSGRDRFARDITLYGLRRALVEILALFPVYRTYITQKTIDEADRKVINEVVKKAIGTVPAMTLEIKFIERFLLLEFSSQITSDEQENWIHFVKKFQQLSGPLMAKGLEDTVFYIYNKLISLNEVGGTPNRFGISLVEFHYFNKKRAAQWPRTMNTTSTHDTKRGEDARARINVLSELPNEWAGKLASWNKLNKGKKVKGADVEIPEKNDEYFFYQTILAAFPLYERDLSLFVERVKPYIIKAVREAKVHTAWLKPDDAYENGFLSFIDAVMTPAEDNRFLKDFLLFEKRIALFGIYNSLSQALLKLTCPGVPDFYQGGELWDLNFVDPDNRRPVDYQSRINYLSQIKNYGGKGRDAFLHEILVNMYDGRIKLYIIHQVLEIRKRFDKLFESGVYLPLTVRGRHKNHVIAFARNHNNQWSITVVPRFFTSLVTLAEAPVGRNVWDDTVVVIPDAAPSIWNNAFTGKEIEADRKLDMAVICESFPVALLTGEIQS